MVDHGSGSNIARKQNQIQISATCSTPVRGEMTEDVSAVVGEDCASGSNTPALDLHGSVGETKADGINDKRKTKEHGILTQCNTLAPCSDGNMTCGHIKRGKKQHGSLSKCNSLVQCEMTDGDMNNTKNKKQYGASICNLFVDILIEILSRLPASSLVRFRYVCKLWLTLITTDPTLPKLQLDRGFKVADCASIITCSVSGEMHRLTMMGADGQRKHTVLEMKMANLGISLSCNGLLCLFGRRNSSLWLFNPSTQQMLRLPSAQQTLSLSKHCTTYCYLAYLPTTEQYKVLRFVVCRKSSKVICEVLTVGALLWRRLMPPSFGIPAWYGVVISGSMYCKMWSSESDASGSQIMSFDFNEEKFDKIQFPKFLAGKDSIFEFEGRLCVAVPNGCESIEIWWLEDIKSAAWIHGHTVSTLPRGFGFSTLRPVLIRNGKILIQSSDDLHYRDLETGECLGYIHHDEILRSAQVHIESLVSLVDLDVLGCGVSSLA